MKLIRVDETAEILKVQPATVYKFIRRGLLPCVKLGRTVRIDEDELARLVKGLPRQAVIEIRNIENE